MPKISRVFLNVDLEVYSRRPLDPLIAALGDSVDVLFLGKQESRYVAAVELAGSGWQPKPDPMIRELVERIKALPESARTLWDNATKHRFDIVECACVRGCTHSHVRRSNDRGDCGSEDTLARHVHH